MNIVFYDGINWDYDIETPLLRPLGGSQSALCYLAIALAERGHTVSLINGTSSPRRVFGVDCYRMTGFPQQVLSQDADVVIVLNGPGDLSSLLRKYVHAQTPIVLWTQHAVDQQAMHPLANPEHRDGWQLIVCVSDWHRASMIKTYQLDPNRTTVMRNAISPRFENMFRGEADFIEHKQGPPVLVYTSTPFRGLLPLVQLFPEVHAEFPDAELRVFSSMKVYQQEGADDPYRFLYEKCLTTPGVRYIGSVSQTRLAEELKRATFLAYPNTFAETSCIAVMEALASGLHVESSALGALPETAMGFATLVRLDETMVHDDFVARHREALLGVMREQARDPLSFARAKWHQVQQTNERYTWRIRAAEWESLLRGFARGQSPVPQNMNVDQAIQLAIAHVQRGDLTGGEQVALAVLNVQATNPQALEILAHCMQQSGRIAEAAQIWERLADVLHFQGNIDVAIQVYQKSLSLDADRGGSWNNLGKIMQERDRFAEAETLYLRAAQLLPNEAQVHTNLGNTYMSLNKLADAERCHRQAITLDPRHSGAWNNLATSLKRQSRLEEAIEAYLQALTVEPGLAAAAYNLGVIYYQFDRLDEAEAMFRRALQSMPDLREALHGLGTVMDARGALGEAEAICNDLCTRFPDYAIGEAALATVQKSLGLIDEAIGHYEHALIRMPPTAQLTSSLLQFCSYAPGMTQARLAEQHARWEKLFGEPVRSMWKPWANSREPERKLRIGFVSADFRYHPVGRAMAPLLQYFDREAAEFYLYAQQHEFDDLGQSLIGMATKAMKVNRMSDEALEAQIRADGIDVLFDLAGHTAGNRLPVFARKPAPVQFTWFGYVGTTGLSAIDYLLADRHYLSADAEQHMRERVVYLPHAYAAYAPLAISPDVNALPALSEKVITFASFSNPAKINHAVGKLWSEILRRVPGSRLMLKFWGYENAGTQAHCRERFTRHGIAPERIVFSGRAQPRDMIAQYHQVDIALDPFPYGGGLTTCEALWMGVPVVTCPGEIFSSRHAYSYLKVVGLPELIASDFDDYVEKAVALANDVERLAKLRGELRERVWKSPLCNARQFAADWMSVVREAWRKWATA